MEAKTIEDRAKEYADGVYSKYSNKHVMNIGYNGYYSGAIEQKQIDIDKACKWLKNNINTYLYNRGGEDEYIPTCGDTMFKHFRIVMDKYE